MNFEQKNKKESKLIYIITIFITDDLIIMIKRVSYEYKLKLLTYKKEQSKKNESIKIF